MKGETVQRVQQERCLVSWAAKDETFWRSQVNFGPANPKTDEFGGKIGELGKPSTLNQNLYNDSHQHLCQ